MPELQWKTEMRDDAEFTSAYRNEKKVITLRKSYTGEGFHTFHIFYFALSRVFEEYYVGNLDEAKLEIQRQFNTFYDRYKPLFQEGKENEK